MNHVKSDVSNVRGPRRSKREPLLTDIGGLERRLIENFDALSPQFQVAARFLLDHPQEIPLRSMRELARVAKVAPATMTRLANELGFSGFDELKTIYTAEIRRFASGYRDKAIELT